MLFKKPKDVRYVDMAKGLDENMYKENVDDNQIFEYLGHLIFMLAKKGKFFKHQSNYEDFASYMASITFFRIKNPKQFGENAKLSKIKSSLNFIKKTIYFRKVSFEQEFYSQIISYSKDEKDVEYNTDYTFSDMLSESVDELSRVEFQCCLCDIKKVARKFLFTIPYKNDKQMWNNIYISCLLTFLNSISLNRRQQSYILSLKYKDSIDVVHSTGYKQQNNSIILYHLDSKFKDYIRVLVKELQHYIANDLSSYLRSYIPNNSNMQYLALSEINNTYSNQEKDDLVEN